MWKLIFVYVHNLFFMVHDLHGEHDCVSEKIQLENNFFITTVFILNIIDSAQHTNCESMKEFEIIKLKFNGFYITVM